MHLRHLFTFALLSAILGSLTTIVACDGAEVDPNRSSPNDPSANGSSTNDANPIKEQPATTTEDTCTPHGDLYACQTALDCEPGYMLGPTFTCSTPGAHCCIKGAILPTQDAAADECTAHGALYACQATAAWECEPEYMPEWHYSCAAPGTHCCVKGAYPPVDAGH